MTPFIGEIIMFGGNFAPRGWAFCDGQLLPISQYTALFSILGTTYGGDGRTTFALPDLRGRFAMHPGNGPGLSSRRLGQKGGQENVTLTVNNMPSHSHSLVADNKNAKASTPGSNYLAISQNDDIYRDDLDTPVNMATGSVANTGGSQSFSVENPFLCVNFIIALEGVFPSRS